MSDHDRLLASKVLDALPQIVEVDLRIAQAVAVHADDHADARHGNQRVDLEASGGATQEALLVEEQMIAGVTDGVGFERG